MRRQSYKIKHDFLFGEEVTEVVIPKLDSNLSEINEIKLSDVLKAKDNESFNKLINSQILNLIIDDIGSCNNPASERYKQFIIKCVCRKLKKENIKVYF